MALIPIRLPSIPPPLRHPEDRRAQHGPRDPGGVRGGTPGQRHGGPHGGPVGDHHGHRQAERRQ